nr:helix-turn-helix transcriptional regulator [uncultured Brevundimonas sp.]
MRRVRIAAGLSQEEVAFRAGMKRSYLSGLELGRRNPTVRALARVSMALEVSPADLLKPDSRYK